MLVVTVLDWVSPVVTVLETICVCVPVAVAKENGNPGSDG